MSASQLIGLKDHTYVPMYLSLDERRTRGEVACAECRRLKLKCDRKIPCGSCIKRQCIDMCPNGANVTKDSTRAVVAASQYLHEEIASLRKRTRVLEHNLGLLHFKRVGRAHPLLCQIDDTSGDRDDKVDRLTQDVSVLHLSNNDGMQRFFGSRVQLPQGATSSSDHAELAPLPLSLHRVIRTFPFPMPTDTSEEVTAVLHSFLPDRAYAERLLHRLFDECIYMLPAMEKTLIFVELLPCLYNTNLIRHPCVYYLQEKGDSPRAFALIYALLALSALLDVHDPGRELHAIRFERLSLAGLGAVSIFEKPSYIAVLAGFFHSVYHLMRQKELSETSRLFGHLAFQTAINMGLFLDSMRWKVPWVVVQRRRRLFWTLFQVNLWECIAIGRPPTICDPSLIDCEFPFDETTEHDPDGPKLARDVISFKRTRDIVLPVVLLTCAIEPPEYLEVLALDATIRTEWLRPALVNWRPDAKLSALKHAVIFGPFRAFVLVSLHRGHFVQALDDSPLDPTQSPYGASFLASVCSAEEILDWMPQYFEADPGRAVYLLPHSWTWALTAAMIMYTIIEKAPYSDCVRVALARLEKMHAVFAAAKSLGGGRAASGLPILQRLCTSSKAIIDSRDKPSTRVAWSIKPGEVWSPDPPTTLQQSMSVLPSASSTQYSWLEDGVSDSYKNLFTSHYREVQQHITPSIVPTPTPPHAALSTSAPAPAASSSYPGYLQHPMARSSKSKRMREKSSVPAAIRLPELLPDVLPAHVTESQQGIPSLLAPANYGSLAGIWLAHSRQLGTVPPNTSTHSYWY